MKAKLKFDKKAILGFLATHGEKIAFGAIVVGSLLLAYLAMGHEKFNQSPEEMANKAQRAEAAIQNASAEVKVDIVKPIAELNRISGKISVDPYAFVNLLSPAIRVPKTLRGEPVLVPVEKLRGAGGLSRFEQTAMFGAGGVLGAGPAAAPNRPKDLGQPYVVLTGIVNHEKLQKAFYDCFKNTRVHTDADFTPVYQFFHVERAEVTSEDEPVENLKWSEPYTRFWDEYTRFSTRGIEVVEQRFVNPAIVFPLPPRTDGKNWGKEAACPPEIPVYSYNAGMPGSPTPGAEPGKEGDPKKDAFGGDDPNMMGGMNPGMAGPAGPAGPMGPMGPMGPNPYGAGPGPGAYGAGPGLGPGAEMGGYSPAGGMYGQPQTPQLLFRFFDYHAEPGKRYRYRVRLRVINPNANYTAQDLVPELRDRMKDPNQWKVLLTPWSEPSDVVAVPREDRILASSVIAPSEGKDKEPRGSIMAIHWDRKKGEEVHADFEVARGWLANFLQQDMPVANTQAGVLGPGAMLGGAEGEFGPAGPAGPAAPARDRRGGRTRARAAKQNGLAAPVAPPPQKIDYKTEMIVLDLRGGERLGRNRLTAPGEILLLDPDGNLEVRGEAEDRKARLAQKNPTTVPGMMGPGMMGPGMMGPGMGPMGPGVMGPRGPGME